MSITVLKSENKDYLAEVCGGEVGERAVEQRHDTDMAVTRSCSLRVSCQTDTQEMNCLTTLVGFGTILSLASSEGERRRKRNFDASFKAPLETRKRKTDERS